MTRPSVAVSRIALSSRASPFCVRRSASSCSVWSLFRRGAASAKARQVIPFGRLQARPRRERFAGSGSHADHIGAVRREMKQLRHASRRMKRILVGKAEQIEQRAVGINRNIVAAKNAERQAVENRRGIAAERRENACSKSGSGSICGGESRRARRRWPGKRGLIMREQAFFFRSFARFQPKALEFPARSPAALQQSMAVHPRSAAAHPPSAPGPDRASRHYALEASLPVPG